MRESAEEIRMETAINILCDMSDLLENKYGIPNTPLVGTFGRSYAILIDRAFWKYGNIPAFLFGQEELLEMKCKLESETEQFVEMIKQLYMQQF